MSWSIYTAVAWLSHRFAYESPRVERPIVEVLCLLAAAFAVYLLALRVAIRASGQPGLLPIIVLFSVCFRLVLLFSVPIQEVDIYRYLWDSQASVHGVSPFGYSPQQVMVSSADERLPDDLARLVAVRDSSAAMRTILSRVHYAELPTVYPPVSQGVFAVAALTTGADSGVSTRLRVMKAWILAFDVATIFVLMGILKIASKPAGWSLAYAWCPLVLKEFANSGHLDSIAVCLTTLSVYFALRAFYRPVDGMTAAAARSGNASSNWAMASSVALGLAAGAKLYPLVLAPLLIFLFIRRLHWTRGILAAGLFLFVCGVMCWPMLEQRSRARPLPHAAEQHVAVSTTSLPPVPPGAEVPDEVNLEPRDPGKGLKVFLSRWKMNDFLFLLVMENVTPLAEVPSEERPWFVATPERWRQTLTRQVADFLPVEQGQVPFALARTAMAIVFLGVAAWCCWHAGRSDEPARFLEAVFLTLAWFWLLLPTQNPWYWIWALPFVPFARNRAWLALSGLTLLYYLRFWLGYHWPNSPVMHTTYSGELFFDYVVTWIEFAPWFVWLTFSSRLCRKRAG